MVKQFNGTDRVPRLSLSQLHTSQFLTNLSYKQIASSTLRMEAAYSADKTARCHNGVYNLDSKSGRSAHSYKLFWRNSTETRTHA